MKRLLRVSSLGADQEAAAAVDPQLGTGRERCLITGGTESGGGDLISLTGPADRMARATQPSCSAWPSST